MEFLDSHKEAEELQKIMRVRFFFFFLKGVHNVTPDLILDPNLQSIQEKF